MTKRCTSFQSSTNRQVCIPNSTQATRVGTTTSTQTTTTAKTARPTTTTAYEKPEEKVSNEVFTIKMSLGAPNNNDNSNDRTPSYRRKQHNGPSRKAELDRIKPSRSNIIQNNNNIECMWIGLNASSGTFQPKEESMNCINQTEWEQNHTTSTTKWRRMTSTTFTVETATAFCSLLLLDRMNESYLIRVERWIGLMVYWLGSIGLLDRQ